MFAYLIIASSNSVIEFTKLMSELGNLDTDYSESDRQLLVEAIKISTAVQMSDFQRFFKLFKATNYMFACLMLNFFEEMRRVALFNISRSHRGALMRGEYVQK